MSPAWITAVGATIVFTGITLGYARRASAIVGPAPSPFTRRILIDSVVLIGSAASLALFAWLLTRHPGSAGRTYAAYGAVYVATAILWLALVEGQRPNRWDLAGVAVSFLGMAIIIVGSMRPN